MLGVVRVAADLTACGAGMAAAAQPPCNVASVGVVAGAHADFKTAILLLAQGQADLDALNGAGQTGQVFQLGPGHACGLDLVPGQADERTAVVVVKFQAFQRHPLGNDPRVGAALEQALVELFHIGTGLDERRRRAVGLRRRVAEPEAAGVGRHARVQAGGDLRRDLRAHLGDERRQQLGGGRRVVVHQRLIGIAAVGAVVVDAQIDVLSVIPDVVALAKQLDTGHIHRHDERRAKAAVKHRDGHIVVHGWDGVAAQHRGVFAQLLQGKAERRARADGIAIRVFMTQDQDVICSKQTRNNGFAIHILSHRFLFSNRVQGLLCVKVGLDVQLTQQLVDVRGIGCAFIFHKYKARCLADVHTAADLGADMAGGLVQRLDYRLGAALAAHDADVDLGLVEVRGHIQAGHGQQTTVHTGVLHLADNRNQLTLHILGHTAVIFGWHLVYLCN